MVASYSGDDNNFGGFTLCADEAEAVIVTSVGPVTPTLTTTASPGGALGVAVTDTATLAGGTNPTGSITFTLHGPGDVACAAPPVFVATETVNGNGTYTSDAFTPTVAGTYRWVAAYNSADAANNSVSTACGDPAETVTSPPPGRPSASRSPPPPPPVPSRGGASPSPSR